MSHHAVLETVCGNCGAELQGAFCHACGQKVTGPDVSLHDFFHEAFHEFAHLDGKIVQTLRLLMTKPGMLTKEFLEGRRARYISPLRLYLTCSLLFPAAVQRYQQEASLQAGHALVHDFPRVMFALMPVFGLLTWVLYRKARPFYAAHLYYSVHFHAFVFAALTLEVSVILVAGRMPRRSPGSQHRLFLCITTSVCAVCSAARAWQPPGRGRCWRSRTCSSSSRRWSRLV